MRFLILMILGLFLQAEIVVDSKNIKTPTLISQHGKEVILDDGIWVVTWDKESTFIANEYFKNHGMLESTYMIVDSSQIPSGIMKLFVKPNMQKYSHHILLSFDANYNRSLPYKEGSLSVLTVKDKTLKSVVFIETQKRLEKFFK